MNILNEHDFKLILQKFQAHDPTTTEYINAKLIPLSGAVEGFMGDYYTLQINYKLNNRNEEKEVKFFVKHMPTQTKFQETIAKERNLYGKEIFFLDYLLKEYEKYKLDYDFAPKCYYCKNDQILVMENLVANNYRLSEKNKLYTLEQCKVGLQALASYHGSSILYEELKSQELGEIYRFDRRYPEMFEENYYDFTFEKEVPRLIRANTTRAVKLILKELKLNEHKDEIEANLTVENILKCFTMKTEFRKATGHGDLWYNNIFFKYANDGDAEKCAIVDYQVMRYFYPAYDVLIFIYLNTSKEFRKLHLPYLLKYYYDHLSEVFEKRGFNINDVLPLKDFNASLKFVESNALFTVIAIGTLVFMSEETLQELYKAMDRNAMNTFEYNYELFCRDFISDKYYRKMLSDAVNDLYDSWMKTSSIEDAF